MSESSEDVAIAAVIAEAWCQWQEREGFERGEPIINQFGAALEALDALRSLPVEERAKAVGFVQYDDSCRDDGHGGHWHEAPSSSQGDQE